MSASEEKKLRAAFEKIDKDGSGRISPQELQQLLQVGNNNHKVSVATCSLLIGLFDEGLGSIDFEGFQSLRSLFLMWSGIFKSYDKDNSGYLEHTEVRVACEEAFENFVFSEAYIDGLIRKFGDTKPGVLTSDEYLIAFAYIKDCPPPKTMTARVFSGFTDDQ